jgi:hypothetical protein
MVTGRFFRISILFHRSKQKFYLGLSPQRGSPKFKKTISTYTKVLIGFLGPSKKASHDTIPLTQDNGYEGETNFEIVFP